MFITSVRWQEKITAEQNGAGISHHKKYAQKEIIYDESGLIFSPLIQNIGYEQLI